MDHYQIPEGEWLRLSFNGAVLTHKYQSLHTYGVGSRAVILVELIDPEEPTAKHGATLQSAQAVYAV